MRGAEPKNMKHQEILSVINTESQRDEQFILVQVTSRPPAGSLITPPANKKGGKKRFIPVTYRAVKKQVLGTLGVVLFCSLFLTNSNKIKSTQQPETVH